MKKNTVLLSLAILSLGQFSLLADTNNSAFQQSSKVFYNKEKFYIEGNNNQAVTDTVETFQTNNAENETLQFTKASNNNSQELTSSSSQTTEDELVNVIKEKQKDKKEWIDTVNFIQPSSIAENEELQNKVDQALTRSEQEQLLILWRATLERNKTIRFIVQKLAPDNANAKRNKVLGQILNTAVFLPFYALQSVAPTDTSALASYLGAGVAGDIINGASRRNKDKLILTQTEMVIMFMMIDEVAERVRDEYRQYKAEYMDSLLIQEEIKEAKEEAAASLQVNSEEAQFLTQIRLRQLERESRRINARLRSNRITLLDLCGEDAVQDVDKLIQKEVITLAQFK